MRGKLLLENGLSLTNKNFVQKTIEVFSLYVSTLGEAWKSGGTSNLKLRESLLKMFESSVII